MRCTITDSEYVCQASPTEFIDKNAVLDLGARVCQNIGGRNDADANYDNIGGENLASRYTYAANLAPLAFQAFYLRREPNFDTLTAMFS